MTANKTNGLHGRGSRDTQLSRLPEDGHNPIVYQVDEIAVAEPSRTLMLKPRSSQPEDGWEPVTNKAFADAVNCAAQLIFDKVKKDATEEFPTVAYIGPNDIRYGIMMIGAIKAGCQALFLSPRNNIEAHVSLCERVNCRHFWYSGPFQQLIASITKQRPMDTFVVPSADEWLSSSAPAFPYTRSPEKTRWDPAIVLHTSGSTGMPKPVIFRQGGFLAIDQYRNLPPLDGAQNMWDEFAARSSRMLVSMPFFHAAGLMCGFVLCSIYHGQEAALPIADQPMTADLFAKAIKYSGSTSAVTAPSILEDLSNDEDGIASLKSLNFVVYGGGALSPVAGNILRNQGITVTAAIATTEHVPWPLYWQSNPDDWQYFVIDSEHLKADWRPHDPENGIYELVITRRNGSDPNGQAVFYNFPDWDEYTTGDLFKAHPTRADNWMHYGRKDNIIVFSNGEKLNPITVEDTIAGHPLIHGALVVGQGRFQAALILEPITYPETEEEAEKLIDKVWPAVEEANKLTVSHGHISRQLISISDPQMPFPRAGKGTVQRSRAIILYKGHIKALYEKVENETQLDIPPFDLSSQDALAKSITQSMIDELQVEGIKPHMEFFNMGIDSLQILTLSKILHSGLKAAGEPIDRDAVAPRNIYNHPTAEKLAGYIFSVLQGDGTIHQNGLSTDSSLSEEFVAKYTRDIVAKNTRDLPSAPLDHDQTILLTGSTGSLGAYILDILCKSPRVSTVVALNRGEDGGKSRQPEISAARGLATDFTKVKFIGVDISHPKLGLGEADYGQLLSSVDRIIHNAWPVNFNISLSSFEPYIRGVRNLVDFSSNASKTVPIVFLSSIGTVSQWSAATPVPEHQLTDAGLAAMGYGQSKLVSSLILDAASKMSGIPTATIRVGQIAGPKSNAGKWNPQEFLPSLIASSVHLGMLPDDLGPQNVVDWMPIEDVAALVLDVAGVTETKPVSEIAGYFHCVNPKTVQWPDLSEGIMDYYIPRIKKLVSLTEWVAALEKSSEGTPDLDKNPAVKLLDTYRGFAQAIEANQPHVYLSMKRTMEHSKTAAGMEAITPEMMRTWCRQWGFEKAV